jgi:hypothetical protein
MNLFIFVDVASASFVLHETQYFCVFLSPTHPAHVERQRQRRSQLAWWSSPSVQRVTSAFLTIVYCGWDFTGLKDYDFLCNRLLFECCPVLPGFVQLMSKFF